MTQSVTVDSSTLTAAQKAASLKSSIAADEAKLADLERRLELAHDGEERSNRKVAPGVIGDLERGIAQLRAALKRQNAQLPTVEQQAATDLKTATAQHDADIRTEIEGRYTDQRTAYMAAARQTQKLAEQFAQSIRDFERAGVDLAAAIGTDNARRLYDNRMRLALQTRLQCTLANTFARNPDEDGPRPPLGKWMLLPYQFNGMDERLKKKLVELEAIIWTEVVDELATAARRPAGRNAA